MKKILLLLIAGTISYCANSQSNSKRISKQNYLQGNSKTNKEKWFNVDSAFIYGAGEILSLVTASEKSDGATSPTGSLGINFMTNRINSNLFFSYSGKETIEMSSLDQLGTTLMNPNLGGHALNFSSEIWLKDWATLALSASIVDQNWKIDSLTSIDATPYNIKLGFNLYPFSFSNITSNKVDFYISSLYVYRNIVGEFDKEVRMIDGEEVKSENFHGFELAANFELNSIRLFVKYNINQAKDNGIDIPGFHGSQVLFGFDVIGQLLKLN